MSEPLRQIEIVGPSQPLPAAQPSEAASILAVISRAASDPATDVDKLERLMSMYERLNANKARAAYAAALAAMQPTLPIINERGRIVIKEKNSEKVIQSTSYALWEDINEAIRPMLAANGFALSFRTGLTDDGKVKVTGILHHRDGHQEETTMVLQHDSTGSKNAVQAVGSSTSYGKRYTAAALLNLTSRGEDDDGQAGGADPRISDEQLTQLRAALDEAKAGVPAFCRAFGLEALTDLPAKRFDEALKRIAQRRGAVK